MKNTRIRTAVLVTALASVVGAGGAAAYFSDSDQAENTFTVGSVDIALTESTWDAWNDGDPAPIVPDQEIPKDPVVTNRGNNKAYVFASVRVPTASIVTAAEDGTRQAAAETQLFKYTANENWTLVSSGITGAGSVSIPNNTGNYGVRTAIDETGEAPHLGYVTYVYAYTGDNAQTMEALEPASSTPVLFPAVQFVNAVEGQALENAGPAITVSAYAIQADFINDGDTAVDGTNGGTFKTAPADVWQVLQTQSGISL